MADHDALSSQYLSRSFSHLSHSRSTNNLIVRSYKQATQLYLTKRFKEALDTLEPIVTPQAPSEQNGEAHAAATNGGRSAEAAPVAQSSKGTRTKVWVFYLSLLHAIVELGPQEGKTTFGSSRWRELAAKARDGTVWDDVIRRGYGGNEGDVDGEVVVNLATLLLGHMSSQKLNQERLEGYLAASDDDATASVVSDRDGTSTPMSVHSSSPKSLATRLKVLELYVLHVLPANEEWDYARQVIEMSELLDEERREAFTHALDGVKEEKHGAALREQALAEQRESEALEHKKQEEARRAEEARTAEEDKARAAADADRARQRSTQQQQQQQQPQPSSKPAKSPTRPTKPPPPPTKAPSSPPSQRGAPQGPRKTPASGPVSARSTYSSVVSSLQDTLTYARRNLNSFSALASLRALFFLFAFLFLLRRDLRVKLRRRLGDVWDKLARTVGMGVKVRYV